MDMRHALFHWTIKEPLITTTLYTVVVWNSKSQEARGTYIKRSAFQIMAKQRYIKYQLNTQYTKDGYRTFILITS